ncbi:MAG: twin-arginine translocase subunit TatC [Actinomycetota bacterium]|nr:twin-arginine translocase subunit TatC [Actinomycetota bacterium]
MSSDTSDTGSSAEELSSMTLVEHLTELRSRLIKCAAAVFVGAIVMWILYPQVLDILSQPLCEATDFSDAAVQQAVEDQGVSDVATAEEDCANLVITDPLQGLGVRMTVAGYGGIALAMPVLLWQLWRFVTPALYKKEKRLAAPFVFFSCVLFVLGATLAYWTLPRALEFLLNIGGDLDPFLTPDRYISLIVKMMMAFGIGFEFPIALVFLQLVGLLPTSLLVRGRRYAIVLIVVLVAVITPSGDPISLAALSVPMYLFYEISILIGWLAQRRKRKREMEASSSA